MRIDFEKWRNKHGLNQAQAAKWIGISRRSWQRYEGGESIPSDDVLLAMAARDAGLKPYSGEKA